MSSRFLPDTCSSSISSILHSTWRGTRAGVNSAPELDPELEFIANSAPELDPELEFIVNSNSGIGIELELPSLELNWNCHHWNMN